MWRVIQREFDDERHVCPINDARPHLVARECWCRPNDDDGVWVHHAADRREVKEKN